jgi:TolA-binding protein
MGMPNVAGLSLTTRAAAAVCATVALAAIGCAGSMKKPETRPVEAVEAPRCDCSQLEGEIDRLKGQVEPPCDTQQLEDQAAALRLRLLEKEAVAQSLREQLSGGRVELEEAIGEVVRSKAKLRSIESKAQAASDIAEGEIALKTAKARYAGADRPPAISVAEQLLAMSAKEFEKQNYGGSLYLAGQARTKIRAAEVQARMRGSVDSVGGEIRFAAPVELTVAKACKLRKSPGLDAEVLSTLPPGTPVTGLSYKGKWVRVAYGDRSTGWIFQTLLAGLE